MRSTLLASVIPLLLTIPLVGCGAKKTAPRSTKKDDLAGMAWTCKYPNESLCEATRLRIEDLSLARDEAMSRGDIKRLAMLSLELNQEEERLRILMSNKASAENMKRLDSKYKKLNDFLQNDLSSQGASPRGNMIIGAREGLPPVIYDQREAQVVSNVMETFGDLYIKASGLNGNGSSRWDEMKVDRPWAGYWFPLKNKTLFEGDSSPLGKLDKVALAKGRPTQSAALESTLADLAQDGWEGRCAAWAMASIMSKEPLTPRVIDGVSFSTSDQKALLTKIYELYPYQIFGIRYDGDTQTDGTLQDVRPEAFHRLFLHQLGREKKAFIIDDSSGIEIWSKPVYRMKWTIQPDPAMDSAFLVQAQPWLIKHRNDESDRLTSDGDRASPELTYRLYVNPRDHNDDGFRVIAGEWLGASLNHHPDTITIPSPGKEPKSSNAEINKVVDLVRSILNLPE